MINLQNPAREQGTYVITLNFFDETGAETSPATLFWTLTDIFGNVKNSRLAVEVTTPSSAEAIVLYGDDLKINAARTELILSVNATYDSVNGTALPLNDEVRFWVENLKKKGSGD